MHLLAEKIRTRLTPPSPESLEAEARKLFGTMEGVPCVEEALKSMR